MKAKIILLSVLSVLFLLVIFACSKEQLTETQHVNLQEIQNDSNWVEILDTINVTDKITCLASSLIHWGTVFNSENDYKLIWDKSVNDYPEEIGMCNGMKFNPKLSKPQFYITNINFNERTVLGFDLMTGPAKCQRHIFINDNKKKYLYELQIKVTSNNDRGDGYYNWISISKLKSGYSISFDTTIVH